MSFSIHFDEQVMMSIRFLYYPLEMLHLRAARGTLCTRHCSAHDLQTEVYSNQNLCADRVVRCIFMRPILLNPELVKLAKTRFPAVDTAVLEELELHSCCQSIAKTDLLGEVME